MMKRTRIIALFFNLYSVSAVAGYECHLKLSHTEDPHKVIAEKSVRIEEGRIISGYMGTLFTEDAKKRKETSLDINAVMSGWKGEEDASIVIIRRATNKRNVETNTISEVMTVKGDNSLTGWFDSYKLDISCEVKESAIDFE